MDLRHILYVAEHPGLFDFSCLGAGWKVMRLPFPATGRRVPAGQFSHVLVDVDLSRSCNALLAKDIVRRLSGNGRLLIACDAASVHSQSQAWALGADALVVRPVSHATLRDAVFGPDLYVPTSSIDAATHTAGRTLAHLFSAAEAGSHLEVRQLSETTEEITSSIRSAGLHEWLVTVCEHHDGTYQHCLLVAGLAAAFGQELGLSRTDQQKLTLAALVHDVGKIKIPYDLLEKSTALTEDEFQIVQRHARYGWQFMRSQTALDPDVVDVILHHHEFLDGSGYPDRLRGGEINDLNRIITICDVFGALLERRSYKPAMPAPAAYEILVGMGRDGKLERALLRAFEPLIATTGTAVSALA